MDEVEASVFDRDDASAPRAPEPVKIEAMREIESENARLAPGAAMAREEAFRTMMARGCQQRQTGCTNGRDQICVK